MTAHTHFLTIHKKYNQILQIQRICWTKISWLNSPDLRLCIKLTALLSNTNILFRCCTTPWFNIIVKKWLNWSIGYRLRYRWETIYGSWLNRCKPLSIFCVIIYGVGDHSTDPQSHRVHNYDLAHEYNFLNVIFVWW